MNISIRQQSYYQVVLNAHISAGYNEAFYASRDAINAPVETTCRQMQAKELLATNCDQRARKCYN
jgi:hypothetical protein